MRKYLNISLTTALLLSLILGTVGTETAAAKATSYKNCTEMHKDYKGGVSLSSSTKNKGGKTKYKPYASKELYEANQKSDRDKDGIACEQ